jgi:oligoendopeptidase F
MTTATASEMDWDLTSYFPSFDGPEMQVFKADLRADLVALQQRAASLAPLCRDNAAQWEAVLLKAEDLTARLSHLGSYIGCLSAADARNEAYAREEAALALLEAESEKLEVELLRALKRASQEDFEALTQRPSLEGCAHFLTRKRQEAQRTMSPEKEVLASDLGVDGLHAWGRLYDTLSGKLEFDLEYPDGRRERRPMSQRRALMEHPDRRVRRAAFEGGNAAWSRVEDVAAAALNAISGTRLTLNKHRGVDHFLDVALFQSCINRQTLEAMFAAIFDHLELPRRILRTKARAMGAPGVAWYDLGAPLPLPEVGKIPWPEGRDLVRRSFSRTYPSLGEFLESACQQKWLEWTPRPGKRPGAFCTGSLLTRESRVYMAYNDTLGDVRTLAHEIGHAFHSHLMRSLRTLAHFYPMTLAEAASTFAEMILTQGVLADAQLAPAQRAAILDMEVGHGAVYLMDIPVRYLFEKSFYEERASGELTVSRLKELMAQTQCQVFGQVLEKGGEDPYFWASKLHFYITGVTFYNFPYTFGFLLSRGLFALFQQEGADFLPRYEEFLRLTGSHTAENLARLTLGCDLESPEFWARAIQTLEEPLKRLEELLPQVLPPSPGDPP